jgi:hypothetical protein
VHPALQLIAFVYCSFIDTRDILLLAYVNNKNSIVMDNHLQPPTIAVIVHVFYLHIWKELVACIRNVVVASSKTDIFITISECGDE